MKGDKITTTHIFDLFFSLYRRSNASEHFDDFAWDFQIILERMIQCGYDNEFKIETEERTAILSTESIHDNMTVVIIGNGGCKMTMRFKPYMNRIDLAFNSMGNRIIFDASKEYKVFTKTIYKELFENQLFGPNNEMNAWYLVQGFDWKKLLSID